MQGLESGPVFGGETPVVGGGPGDGEGVVGGDGVSVGPGVGGRLVLHGEAAPGEVDVQGPHLQAETAGVVQHGARGVEAHGLVVLHGAEELGRVVGLQVGGGVADDGEADRVALVEAVGGETLQLAEDLAGRFLGHAPLHGVVHEGGADLGHLLAALVAGHGAAQGVGLGGGEPRHQLGHPQHLLLVEDDPVGVAQGLGHGGVGQAHLLVAPAPVDERTDHLGLQGPRAVEGDGGDDVVEGALLQARGQVALAGRLQLEEPDRPSVGDDLVGGGVGGSEGVRVDPAAGALPDDVHRLRHRRVGAEPEDVHLDQAQVGDVVLVELDHRHPLRGPLQGSVIGDGLVGDDEAPQVRAQVDGEAVETLHQVEEGPVAGLVLQRALGQFGPLAGQVVAHLGGVAVTGHVLGEGVDLGGSEAHRLGRDAHGHAWRHGVDVGHHGHVLVTEGVVDVVDDLVAAGAAEVHVDVGHLPTVGVEEAFEEQVVTDGLRGGDVEHVTHQGVAGRAAAAAGDASRPGPAHDVVHHQEVVGESHLLDHGELVVEEFQRSGRHRPVEALHPPEAALGQQRVGGLTGRDGHLGEVVGAEF